VVPRLPREGRALADGGHVYDSAHVAIPATGWCCPQVRYHWLAARAITGVLAGGLLLMR
jgi:hypothetical protein